MSSANPVATVHFRDGRGVFIAERCEHAGAFVWALGRYRYRSADEGPVVERSFSQSVVSEIRWIRRVSS